MLQALATQELCYLPSVRRGVQQAHAAECNTKALLQMQYLTLNVPAEYMSASTDYMESNWDKTAPDQCGETLHKICSELLAVVDLIMHTISISNSENLRWSVVGKRELGCIWRGKVLLWQYHWKAFQKHFMQYWVWKSWQCPKKSLRAATSKTQVKKPSGPVVRVQTLCWKGGGWCSSESLKC